MRVLIVEDDYFSREMMHQLFLQDGFEAVGVESGEEALEAIDRMQFDLVLTDINLDGINGFQLCERLRTTRNLDASTLPVIGVTVDPDSEQLSMASEKGMLTILKRPVTPSDVIEVLERGAPAEETAVQEEMLAVFDPTAVSQLAEVVGSDKVVNLIDMFFTDLEKGLKELLGLIEGKDNEAAGRLAHRLAGSCANYGFLLSHKKLKQVQYDCEKSGCDESAELVGEVLAHIDSDRQRVGDALV
jgi:CheY-like chemotaxis protein/HPt (histidine-containing phosphotransfer) domain-containing protein